MTQAAAETGTGYDGTFAGWPDQVAPARHAVARHLAGCSAADDAELIVSELASNAVLHSASAARCFTVRCCLYPDYVWVECEDFGTGGPWTCYPDEARLHGLDIVEALAGPGNWGVEEMTGGGRVVWVRLELGAQ